MSVERFAYHGWPDCYRISNGCVEVTVVPSIGRIMQLRLPGRQDGPFWENRALDGQLHDPTSREWFNFGGEKCWPAPQTSWLQQQGREWPPPAGFDSRSVEVASHETGITLTSPVDSAYGIQVVRHMELEPDRPTMRMCTEYKKLAGPAVKVAVWTITQMHEPERVFALLPAESAFANGHIQLLMGDPADLKIEGRLLSLVRHPQEYIKLGTAASSLVWVGPNGVVQIDVEQKQGEYPDGGCVTEIYTNPDPHRYVELEALGPLTTMLVGDRIELNTVHTLLPRSTPDPDAEARTVLNWHSAF